MSLDRRESVILRVGRPGSGKSWSAVRYLVDDYLPNHSGTVFTNLPLKLDAIIAYCKKRYRLDDVTADAWRARIHLFPPDVVESWLEGHDIPATYFDRLLAERAEADGVPVEEVEPPIARGLVMIDEAGKMWPNQVEDPSRKQRTAELARWLRTIRHHGARVVFIMQDEKQLSASIRRLSGVMLECANLASRRENVTGAIFHDWLQLRALVFRSYLTLISEIEYVKEGDGWVKEHQTARFLWPKYFPLYDSHNLEGQTSGSEEAMEWQRFGPIRFLLWVLGRNLFNWGWRFAFVCLVYAAMFPPFFLVPRGVNWLRTDFVAMITAKMSEQKNKVTASSGKPAAASSSAAKVEASAGGDVEGLPVDQLRSQLVAERSKRTELEQRLGASSDLVYIDSKGAITDDGDRWNVGRSIEFGRYKGEVVESVDVEAGRVRLVNGAVLRLRRASDAEAPEAKPAKPSLAGKLQAGGAGPGGRVESPASQPADIEGVQFEGTRPAAR